MAGAIDYGSGDYGDIDTQYRTETDQFAQIISTGSGQTIAAGEISTCSSSSFGYRDELYYTEISYWNPVTEQFTTHAVGYWNRQRHGGELGDN